MRTQLDPAASNTTRASGNAPSSNAELVELGLMQAGANPQEQREAIRVFQQSRHLPETGVLDAATRAELEDSVRMHRSMLRNAAAAGEGAPLSDSVSTIASAESLAMARLASSSSTPRAITHPRTAQALGRNLSRRNTRELVSRATRLQQTLDETSRTSQTVSLRRAVLTSLMALYDEVDRRVQSAPINEGLPQLGVEWDPCSPLAGCTADLHPFSNRDQWAAELASLPRPRRRVQPPTPAPTPPRPGGVPATDVPISTTAAEKILHRSEGGALPGWVPPAATPVLRIVSEVVSEVIAPIGGLVLNVGQLFDAWLLTDRNHDAAGRALGAELALTAAMVRSDGMPEVIRDGHISAAELLGLVRANDGTRYHFNRQLEMAATGRAASRRAMTLGVGFAAGLLNQALRGMQQRLDRAGITDPTVREQAVLEAVRQAAERAQEVIAERNRETRAGITGR